MIDVIAKSIKNTYKISVCIPAYNAEKYIEDCLKSVLTQSIFSTDVEIVIVNDCSTDMTHEKIQKMIYSYTNITYIKSKKNNGEGVSRNIAINKCKGIYVIQLDSDDYLSENSLEKMLTIAENYNSEVVIGGVNIVSEKGKLLSFWGSKEDIYQTQPVASFTIFHLCTGFHVSMLIKKSLLFDNSIFYKEDVVTSTDGFFLFTLVDYAQNISIISNAVTNYRQVQTSITHKKRSMQYYIDDFSAYETLLLSKKYNEDLHLRRFVTDICSFFLHDIFNDVQLLNKKEKEKLFCSIAEMFSKYNLADSFLQCCVKNNNYALYDKYFLPFIFSFQSKNYKLIDDLISLKNNKKHILNSIPVFSVKNFIKKILRILKLRH